MEESSGDDVSDTCLGMVFRGVDDIDLGRIPMPRIEVPTDAVLRVIVCGICGSDLHPLHGKEPCALGTVFGHECVGEVVSTGSDISGFNVGDRYHLIYALPICSFQTQIKISHMRSSGALFLSLSLADLATTALRADLLAATSPSYWAGKIRRRDGGCTEPRVNT
jgi:hypothetical protein